MKAETWQALRHYKEKFGKDFEMDISKIKNSEESALIADIREAMKKPVRKKRTADIQITGDIVEK